MKDAGRYGGRLCGGYKDPYRQGLEPLGAIASAYSPLAAGAPRAGSLQVMSASDGACNMMTACWCA
jgi:hypothetical protein